MTHARLLLAAAAALCLTAGAHAQSYQGPNPGYNQNQGFNEGPAYRQAAPPSQGFNVPNDRIETSPDPRYYRRYDDRYSQTYQQQQAEPRRPGGGCLRYGAVGAAGGHLAGHGVLGAVAGCVVGRVVRNRDRARIEQGEGR